MHKAAVRKPIIGGPPVSRAFHTGHEEIKGKKEKGIQVVKKKQDMTGTNRKEG